MTLSQRPLGTTGFSVTPLCLGCAALGNMRETFTYGVSEEGALATLRAIIASPINFADTAASYGDGESERRIGIVLRVSGGASLLVLCWRQRLIAMYRLANSLVYRYAVALSVVCTC